MDLNDFNIVARFKEQAQKFWNLWETLNSKKSDVAKMDPKLQQEYNAVMNRGLDLRGTIEKATSTVDYLYSLGKKLLDTVGLNGVPFDTWTRHTGLGALGILPLIPIAVIAAAVTAMTYWIVDAVEVLSKINHTNELIKAGVTPEAAHALTQNVTTNTPSAFTNLNKTIGAGTAFLIALGVYKFFTSRGK